MKSLLLFFLLPLSVMAAGNGPYPISGGGGSGSATNVSLSGFVSAPAGTSLTTTLTLAGTNTVINIIGSLNTVTNGMDAWLFTNNLAYVPIGNGVGYYTNWPSSYTAGLQEVLNLFPSPVNSNADYSGTPVIHLQNGWYKTTAPLYFRNNTKMVGAGISATMIRYVGTSNCVPFQASVGAADNVVQNTNLANLFIYDMNFSYNLTNVQTFLFAVTNNQATFVNVAFCGPDVTNFGGILNLVYNDDAAKTPSGLVGLVLNCASPPTMVQNCVFCGLADGIDVPGNGNYAEIVNCVFSGMGFCASGGYTNIYNTNSIFNFGAGIISQAGYGYFEVKDCYYQACNSKAALYDTVSWKFENNSTEGGNLGYLIGEVDGSYISDFPDPSHTNAYISVNPNTYGVGNYGGSGGLLYSYFTGDANNNETAIFDNFPLGGTTIFGDGYISINSQNVWTNQNTAVLNQPNTFTKTNTFAGVNVTNGLNANSLAVTNTGTVSNLVVTRLGTAGNSAYFGSQIAVSTSDGREQVVVGNMGGNSCLFVGQDATDGLNFFWNYNATPSSAFGLLETYAGNEQLILQQHGVGTNSFVGIGQVGAQQKLDVLGSILVRTNVYVYGSILGTNGFASLSTHIPTAVTLAASPATFTNNQSVALECYLSGGTAYSVAKNGATVFGSLAGDSYLVLQPTNQITITYTVAPTLYTNNW